MDRRGKHQHGAHLIPLVLLMTVILCAAMAGADDFPYEGTLRVMVVEPISRWQDSHGIDFRYGFLDWAAIAGISLNDTTTWDTTVIWNAETAGYSDITQDNIMVIAAVFNADGEIRDSFHPNGYYFTAHPVDATAAATPGSPGANQSSEDCTHTVLIEAGLNHT